MPRPTSKAPDPSPMLESRRVETPDGQTHWTPPAVIGDAVNADVIQVRPIRMGDKVLYMPRRLAAMGRDGLRFGVVSGVMPDGVTVFVTWFPRHGDHDERAGYYACAEANATPNPFHDSPAPNTYERIAD